MASPLVYVWVLLSGVNGQILPPIPFETLKECLAAEVRIDSTISEKEIVAQKVESVLCMKVGPAGYQELEEKYGTHPPKLQDEPKAKGDTF